MTRLLLAFVLLSAVAVSCADAAPITYTILSFHGTGNAGHNGNGTPPVNNPVQGVVAGTITTDGALGDITGADITSWSWNIGGAAGSSSGDGASITALGIFATPTTLSLLSSTPYDQVGDNGPGRLEFLNQDKSGPSIIDQDILNFQALNGGISWSGSSFVVIQGGTYYNLGGIYSYPSLEIAAVGGGIPPGIPEPSTITLAAIGLGAFGARWGYGRRGRRQAL